MISLKVEKYDARRKTKAARALAQPYLVGLADAGSGDGRRPAGGSQPALMPRPKPVKEIWRFQRDAIYPDVVTGMTKDRKRWVFITAASDPAQHAAWARRFGKRTTIYAEAVVGLSAHKPHVAIVREVDEW